MTGTAARRRGHGEDAIYFDAAKNRYVGAVSLDFRPDGKRQRRKVTGRTKQEVRDKLKALHAELDRGLRTSAAYTVRQAVDRNPPTRDQRRCRQGWFVIMVKPSHLCKLPASTNSCGDSPKTAEPSPSQSTCATRPHLPWSSPLQKG
jgi:hypothetical protein